jgi:glucokinase
MSYLLAADIGGTNSRFALFALQDAPPALPDLELVREQWLPTAQYGSFTELVRDLRLPDGAPFVPPGTQTASLGIAGPVRDGCCAPPNIAWSVHTGEAAAALGIPAVLLVNDFVAQGYACLLAALDAGVHAALDITELHAGKKSAAPLALVGAGSGCGKALVLPETRVVLPSEGGHGEFPFRRDEEAFANSLRDKLGEEIVVEMPVSGEGLCRLFAFHCGENLPPDEICSRLSPPRTATEQEPLAWFARFYGRVCRNFVLDTLALGGLYVTGGMAARIPVLEHPAFLESFRDSEAMGGLLRDVPVSHIRSQRAGLWGAAAHGMMQSARRQSG